MTKSIKIIAFAEVITISNIHFNNKIYYNMSSKSFYLKKHNLI